MIFVFRDLDLEKDIFGLGRKVFKGALKMQTFGGLPKDAAKQTYEVKTKQITDTSEGCSEANITFLDRDSSTAGNLLK